MFIWKYFLILFFSLVALAGINMSGYSFSKPIAFAFDVRSNYTTQTRIYYKNGENNPYTLGQSVTYLATVKHSNPEEFQQAIITLNNARHITSLKIEFDASNDNTLCFRNVNVSDKLNNIPLHFANAEHNFINVTHSGSDMFCFDISHDYSEAVDTIPTIEFKNLLVDARVDYFSPWQIVLLVGIFLLFTVFANWISALSNRKITLGMSINGLIYEVFIVGSILCITLFIVNEVLTSYNIHERDLILISIGLIFLKFLVVFRKVFIKHDILCLSGLLLFFLMMIRYAVFKDSVGTIYAHEFLGYLHIIKQDLPFDVAVILLLSMAFFINSKVLKVVLSVLVIFTLIIMFSDYAINTHDKADRLLFSDFSNFNYKEILRSYFEIFISFVTSSAGILTIAGVIVFSLLLKHVLEKVPEKQSFTAIITRFWVYLIIESLAVWGYFINIGTSSVYDDKFYNTLAVNNSIENLDFSNLSASSSESFYMKKGLNTNKNVVLLVVDSLSSFKSALYGGEDYMPKLDEIARQNAYFPNFYANAYNHEIAMLEMLTGKTYLHNGSIVTAYEFYKNSVPKELHKHGYKSIFMHSANLSKTERAQYDLFGFDYNVDNFEGFYTANVPRYIRQGVDTEQFLLSAASKIDYWMHNQKMKFFLTLVSSFSQSPYLIPVELRKNPQALEYSLDKVTSYNDEQIAKFINKLEEIGFFDNGVLLITSNHRAQVSLTKKEYNEYGLVAITRVPFIIIDKDLSKKEHAYDNDLSLTSIPELIYYLTLDEYQGSTMRVNPFIDHHNDDLIIYQKSAPRNEILLKQGDTTGTFIINGNKSDIIGNLYDKERTFGDILHILKDEVYNPKNWKKNRQKRIEAQMEEDSRGVDVKPNDNEAKDSQFSLKEEKAKDLSKENSDEKALEPSLNQTEESKEAQDSNKVGETSQDALVEKQDNSEENTIIQAEKKETSPQD
ncbi:MAG: sulfatase-like hydrolase/transferase [Succinivibrionaceae bacterium]|nr:sulfatase-like hydrolase/transferase [Succinivibrionaceae bacterium]